jgi:hypothetical protein
MHLIHACRGSTRCPEGFRHSELSRSQPRACSAGALWAGTMGCCMLPACPKLHFTCHSAPSACVAFADTWAAAGPSYPCSLHTSGRSRQEAPGDFQLESALESSGVCQQTIPLHSSGQNRAAVHTLARTPSINKLQLYDTTEQADICISCTRDFKKCPALHPKQQIIWRAQIVDMPDASKHGAALHLTHFRPWPCFSCVTASVCILHSVPEWLSQHSTCREAEKEHPRACRAPKTTGT